MTDQLWRWTGWLTASLVLAPLGVILFSWTQLDPETWTHLQQTLLPTLLRNTALLIIGVSIGVSLLGISLAWLTSLCDFPGRRWLAWGLMLPFALPTYVLAFVFLGLFDFAGPVQSALRTLFGLPADWSFEARHPLSVILVMSLVLYPYVYLLARTAFMAQGRSTFDAARSLGLGTWASFWRVSLPLARPAMIAGLSLALMEALADFGTVSVFSFDTFTTAIYKVWSGFFDLNSAAQLASLLLLVMLLILWLEQYSRGRARFTQPFRARQRRIRLHGLPCLLATGYTWSIFVLAFVLPVAQLINWVWTVRHDLTADYLALTGHTLLLGTLAAGLTVGGALALALARRQQAGLGIRISVRLGTLGYALPGSVLAVGVMLCLTWLDQHIADLVQWLTGADSALLLTGTLVALLIAYVIRFLAVAYGPVDAGLHRLQPSLCEAARTLGADSGRLLRHLYLPILRPGLLAAALLVMVDVMKEMPATLLLRPFGWDTLAVRLYGLTSEGEWERAALSALMLVCAGLVPVLLLHRTAAMR